MLSSLILEGFKAFGERQIVPLAPITLIFGANSAGKSSILQSLLVLKQTLAQAESNETLLLPKGDLVDLGNFRELVFGHDEDRVCEIAPLVDLQQTIDRNRIPVMRPYRLAPPAKAGIGFRFGFDSKNRALRLVGLPHYWLDEGTPAYELVPVRSQVQFERSLGRTRYERSRSGFGSYSTFVALGSVIEHHPIWNELYSEFGERFRADFLDRLKGQSKERGSSQYQRAGDDVIHRILYFSLREALDEPAMAKRADEVRAYVDRLIERLSNYSISRFLEDIRSGTEQRAVALRNFLPDEVVYSRVGREDLERVAKPRRR